jgi:hypothetical protein
MIERKADGAGKRSLSLAAGSSPDQRLLLVLIVNLLREDISFGLVPASCATAVLISADLRDPKLRCNSLSQHEMASAMQSR